MGRAVEVDLGDVPVVALGAGVRGTVFVELLVVKQRGLAGQRTNRAPGRDRIGIGDFAAVGGWDHGGALPAP